MPDTERPEVALANPLAGATVSGAVQVSANASDNIAVGSVQFYLDGKSLGAPVTKPPYAISWNTAAAANGPHTLTATATDTSGNEGFSAPVEVSVENPAEEGPCFVVDVDTSAEGSKHATTQKFTSAEPGEQLFAFVSADGPPGAETQTAKVSGGGLAWRLVRRANSEPGDAEIWTAQAPKVLKRKRVKSTLKVKGYDQLLTVISVEMSSGAGTSSGAGGEGSAPQASLATSEEGSLVYAVGSDWSAAASPSPGPNQVLLHENLDTLAGKTFWTQYFGAVTGPAGEVVTLDDTAPSSDRWNMAAVEILGDGPGK
jgi:hypothetical protein